MRLHRFAPLLLIAGFAAGQDPQPAPVDSATASPPGSHDPVLTVVVGPTRGPRLAVEVPAAVSVIDEQSIRLEEPARSFPELLQRTPGVSAQETAPGQGSPFVRGLTGYRVLTLVDGVRVNGTFFRDGPNQYLAGIDPLMIERVEVIRSQGSTLYGSDALGGVLGVYTRNPQRPDDVDPESWWARPGSYVRVAAPLRDGGELEVTPRIEVEGGRGPIAVIGGWDYVHFGDRETGEHRSTARNTQYSQTNGDMKLVYDVSEQDRLTLAFQRSDQRNVPRAHSTVFGESYRGTAIGNNLRRDLDQSRQLVYFQAESKDRGPFARVKANASLQRHYEQQTRDRSSGRTRTGFEVWSLGAFLEAESDLPLPVDTTLSYGMDYYHDFVDSFETDRGVRRSRGALADDAHYDLFGVYSRVEVHLSRVDLFAGARYSLARVVARDVDPDTTDTFAFGRLVETYDAIVGSGGAVLKLVDDPNGLLRNLNLVGSINQGFRAPNLSDTTNFQAVRSTSFDSPNPNLDPEHSLSLEVGLKWDARHLGLNAFSGQAFYSYTFLEEFMTRVPTGNTVQGLTEFVRQNVSDGSIQTIDGEVELNPFVLIDALSGGDPGATPSALHGLALRFRGSWTRGYLDAFVAGRPTKSNLSRANPARMQLAVRWTEPTQSMFWAEIELDAVRQQTRLAPSDVGDTQRIPPGGTPGYVLWHVRAGANLFEQRLRVSVGVENLADTDYRIHGSGTNGPGRRLVFALQLRF